MKQVIFFLLFSILLQSFAQAQSIRISNGTRSFVRGAAGTTTVHAINFSVVNCVPARTVSAALVNTNGGTMPVADYNITAFTSFPAGGVNGTFTVTVIHPNPLPTADQNVVLRFQLNLVDTVIFSYDTINFTLAAPARGAAPAPAASAPAWQIDTSNKWKYEYNQFTDLLGFDNQRPNGLLQIELVLKFPLIKNRLRIGGNNSGFYFQAFRSLVFHMLINRIDKSKESQNYPIGTTLPNDLNKKDSIRPYLTTMDILKYSNLQLGLNLNVLTFHVGNMRLNFDYEYSLFRNRPYYNDSVLINYAPFKADDLRPVYSHVHKYEVYANNANPIAGKLGVAINAGLMYIRLKDGFYKQFDAAEVDPFDRTTTLIPASSALIQRQARTITFFSGTFKVFWGKKLENQVFFRTNYYYQSGTYSKYGGSSNITQFDPKRFYSEKFHNHFLQLQLGLALKLNEFLGVKED